MDIVGDVHYYIIRHEHIKELSTKSPSTSKTASPILETIAGSIKHMIASVSDALHPHSDKMDSISTPTSPNRLFKRLKPTHGTIHSKIMDINARRNSEDDAFSEVKMVPSIVSLEHQPRNIVKLEQEQLRRESIHKKIRSRTFRNEHHRGSVNIEDWVLEQLNHDKALKFQVQEQSKQKARSKHQATTIEKGAVRKRSSSPSKKQAGEVKIAVPPSPLHLTHKYITAEYYATDDEFLMKSTVRGYFKKNALEQTDYVLFSLTVASDRPNGPEHLHPVMPNVGYMYEPHPATPLGNFRRKLKKFAHSRYAKYVAFLYFVMVLAVSLSAGELFVICSLSPYSLANTPSRPR